MCCTKDLAMRTWAEINVNALEHNIKQIKG